MRKTDPTYIGRVRHVLGAQVTVELDDNIAGVMPIYKGRIQPIGQIGSIVRLPQGLVDLVAQVTLLGIAELAGTQEPGSMVQTGKRWLQIQLLGEIDRSLDRFRRGVGSYPGLDDPVHFTTAEDLAAVYPPASKDRLGRDDRLEIGHLSADDSVPVSLHAGHMVLRHSAIVGSTGSGKTTTVATVLQRFAQGRWPAANIVVIDLHSEYAQALEDKASNKSVLKAESARLQVPYWALPAENIIEIFAGSAGGETTKSRFNELIADRRRDFAKRANWLKIAPTVVTADTPIPFDIRDVWYKLDYENNATFAVQSDPEAVCLKTEGSARDLISAQFEPYSQGSAAPFKGPYHGIHDTIPERLRLGLFDPRLALFREPMGDPDGEDPLPEVLTAWLGVDKPVSILDFSGVPAHASELAIGIILDMLFELAVNSDYSTGGIGRSRPVLIVLEEAHRYLGDSAAYIARNAANRIAREGRKYGVGLLLVTQRPSELPDTALAQCGTIIAMRLTNSADQSKINAALPDGVSGLSEVLPSLRTGEAIITGESIILPSRTLIDRPDPSPASDDPSLETWQVDSSVPNLTAALEAWRSTYDRSNDD